MKSTPTIGEILVEILATERGDRFLEPIELIEPFPSGAPAIFIVRLSADQIIGCVGDDDFGRANLNILRRDGVDLSGI
jgi:sugar/nucleoside kinase (ribokinase family)